MLIYSDKVLTEKEFEYTKTFFYFFFQKWLHGFKQVTSKSLDLGKILKVSSTFVHLGHLFDKMNLNYCLFTNICGTTLFKTLMHLMKQSRMLVKSMTYFARKRFKRITGYTYICFKVKLFQRCIFILKKYIFQLSIYSCLNTLF